MQFLHWKQLKIRLPNEAANNRNIGCDSVYVVANAANWRTYALFELIGTTARVLFELSEIRGSDPNIRLLHLSEAPYY